MSSRIPPLLEPYLGLPEEASLIVLTSVLGASTNWLVLRYLYSFLSRGRQQQEGGSDEGSQGHDTGLVLVSFLRDGAFWHDGAGRLGLDLEGLSRTGRFSFVDGLTGMFMGPQAGDDASGDRQGSKGKARVLRSSQLDEVRKGIEAALGDVRTSRKVLVVDQLDVLLAITGDQEGVNSLAMENMLLSLREHVHATVLTFAADAPLLQSQATTLERQHAALVLSQVHAADAVLSLRMLDTGVAKDVSGVMRITGGSSSSNSRDSTGIEYLYHVGGDGGVKVFERGA